MVAFPSPSNFSAVARILNSRSPAVRTEDDLHCIAGALDPSLNAADVVWKALSARQKLHLCKYFESRTVFEDDCQQRLCVEKRTARGAGIGNSVDSDPGGLYVLVRGKATISCEGRSLIVHGATGWKVLGRLSLPSGDARAFLKRKEAGEGTVSSYHRFVPRENGRGGDDDVAVRFEKGATYLVLPEHRSRRFLDGLNASLIARRALNDVGIARLLRVRTHEEGCARESLLMDGENRATRVFRFRAGQIMIKEGDAPDRVLFLATGSCLVFRSGKGRETHCVGSMSSPCFVGTSALVGRGDSDDEVNAESDGMQPVSIVAATDGYAFSFCPHCFSTSVDKAPSNSELVNAFRFLARSQMTAWMVRSRVMEEEAENQEEIGEEDSSTTTEDGVKCVEDEQELIHPNATNIQKNSVAEKPQLQVGESANEYTPIDNLEAPIELDLNTLTGKLNRSKFLSAMHDSLSMNLGESVIKNDLVHNREKWLLDGNKDNILSDVMEALSEGCGVDVTKCQGNDPFHDFTVDELTETASAGIHMSLQMPGRTPNRVRRMAEKCLGRKRPPEYDDSDPFLKPYPSVVSRKMHGKTLPVVRRMECADPLVFRRNQLH